MTRRIVEWVNGVAATVFALYLLLLCLFGPLGLALLPQRIGGVGGTPVSAWWWLLAFLVGAAVLAANVVFLIAKRRGGGLARTLRITTEGGSTALSLAALENELVAGLSRQADLSGIKVTLEQQTDGLPILCDLKFRTSARQDLPGRIDRVKKQVRDLFLAMFPAGLGLEIHAEVTHFTGASPTAPNLPAAPAAGDKPAAPAEEFSGPVYPDTPDDGHEEAGEGPFPGDAAAKPEAGAGKPEVEVDFREDADKSVPSPAEDEKKDEAKEGNTL